MDCPTSFQPYTLSPLDHLLPHIYMVGFASFAPQDTRNAISTLRDAVYWLMKQLPFLGGDVFSTETSDKQNVWAVKPTNVETLNRHPIFQMKRHSECIAFVEDPQIFSNAFSAFPIELQRRDSYPFIRFQANVMHDGIIFTTTAFHPAMDGRGYFNLLHAISGYCRVTESPPLFTSPQLESETRRKLSAVQSYTAKGPSRMSYSNRPLKSKLQLTSRKLFLSAERLQRLKEKCQSKDARRGANLDKLSLNDVVCAVIWICMTQARYQAQRQATLQSISTSKNTSLGTVVDARTSILSDLIPAPYIGNALLLPATTYPLGPMIENPGPHFIDTVTEVARRLKRAREGITTEHAKSVVASIQRSSNWGSLVPSAPDGVVSSLRYVKVYDWDFGPNLGFIKSWQTYDSRLSGRCWIMPARSFKTQKVADWEISLALEADAWEYLETNRLFRWACGAESAKL